MTRMIRVTDLIDLVYRDRPLFGHYFEIFVDEVSQLPAIEAEPVRHSKWIPKIVKICGVEHELGMKCERCGEEALSAEGDDFLTDYCPCCGARMDGSE